MHKLLEQGPPIVCTRAMLECSSSVRLLLQDAADIGLDTACGCPGEAKVYLQHFRLTRLEAVAVDQCLGQEDQENYTQEEDEDGTSDGADQPRPP